MNYKLSIIIPTYNSDFSKLLLTLDSIINQTNRMFEIIITDDGSKKFDKDRILSYFTKNEFIHYQLIENSENIGTVKNIQNAYRKANGEYICAFGPGDILYEQSSIEKFIEYLDLEKPNFGFSRFQSYYLENNSIVLHDFQSPPERVIKQYTKNKKALKYMVLYGTYCCGATLFFKKEFIIQNSFLITTAKYCEDLVQVLIALTHEKIYFYDTKFIFYEFGSGISTKKETSSLIKADNINFYIDLITKNNTFLFFRKKIDILISSKGFLLRKILRLILFPDMYLFYLLNNIFSKFINKKCKNITEYKNYLSFWKSVYDN